MEDAKKTRSVWRAPLTPTSDQYAAWIDRMVAICVRPTTTTNGESNLHASAQQKQ